VLLALAAALVVALGQRQRDLSHAYERLRERATLPHAGLELPGFSASTLDGARVTVGAAATPGTRQVLFVLRTGCPYRRATLPVWERIADSLRRAATPAIELYAISLDSADSTKAYVRANHLSYPVLTFPERKLVSLYRAVATPETLVLDGGGRVLYARTGLQAKPRRVFSWWGFRRPGTPRCRFGRLLDTISVDCTSVQLCPCERRISAGRAPSPNSMPGSWAAASIALSQGPSA
jgi:peroxiredoxin